MSVTIYRAEYERRLRNIPIAKLARDMDTNEASVHMVLKGKRPMTDYYRERFASVLGMEPDAVDALVQVHE